MAGGRYGGLRDEVPGRDVEWDVGGGEEDREEFDISPPRGVRREAAERSRRRRDEEAYMEGVLPEHLGSAYVLDAKKQVLGRHRSRKHNLQHAYAPTFIIFHEKKRPRMAVFWSKIEFFGARQAFEDLPPPF